MLINVVRITAFTIAVFLGIVTFLFLVAEEQDFPAGASYSLSISFTDSPFARDDLIEGITHAAAADGARVMKVIADPEDFYNGRSLYEFGRAPSSLAQEIDWFTPHRYGSIRPISDLGFGSLDGRYIVVGSSNLSTLGAFVAEADGRMEAHAYDALSVMGYALFNTGAWLPLTTCVLLSATIAVSWSVLRSRARTLTVLSGASTGAIIVYDLVSLARSLLAFSGIGVAGVAAVVSITSGGVHVMRFLLVLSALAATALVLTLAIAGLVTVSTWPTVRAIASRRPPERHFRIVTEMLKVCTVVLLAVTFPLAITAGAEAAESAAHQARWSALKDEVGVRVGGAGDLEDRLDDLAALAIQADIDAALTMSYTIAVPTPTLPLGSVDGIALVNPRYLDLMNVRTAPLRADALRPEVERFLVETHEIWTRGGDFATDFSLYSLEQGAALPVLGTQLGEMNVFSDPLVVVVDSPGRTLDESSLASLITSGNLLVEQEWAADNVPSSSAGDLVLSLDRAADAGLSNAQGLAQTAFTRFVSLVLEFLALGSVLGVSAVIYAISHARRLFVERTAGLSWPRILGRRGAWEAGVAALLFAIVTLVSDGVWWAGALLAVVYVAVTATIHLSAARFSFARALVRAM